MEIKDKKEEELLKKWSELYVIILNYIEIKEENESEKKNYYIAFECAVYNIENMIKNANDNLDIYKLKEDGKKILKDFDFQQNHDLMELYFELVGITDELIKLYEEKNSEKTTEEIVNLDFLSYSLTGKVKEETLETSVLDNYRNWGIERIALDGFQNHLPEDSKGKNCFLQFYVDNKWVDCEEAKKQRDKIQKIRFADDGVGFDKNNLRFLSSQKTSEDLSVGQFGEGLKLIAMASVNVGLDLEVQSRNWTARATGKPVEYLNYRNQELGETKEERTQLVWKVSEYDAEPIKRIENDIS